MASLCSSRGFIPVFWGGGEGVGSLLFHFILSNIVAELKNSKEALGSQLDELEHYTSRTYFRIYIIPESNACNRI